MSSNNRNKVKVNGGRSFYSRTIRIGAAQKELLAFKIPIAWSFKKQGESQKKASQDELLFLKLAHDSGITGECADFLDNVFDDLRAGRPTSSHKAAMRTPSAELHEATTAGIPAPAETVPKTSPRGRIGSVSGDVAAGWTNAVRERPSISLWQGQQQDGGELVPRRERLVVVFRDCFKLWSELQHLGGPDQVVLENRAGLAIFWCSTATRIFDMVAAAAHYQTLDIARRSVSSVRLRMD